MNPPPFKERIKNILIEYNLLSAKSRELLTLQFNKNKRYNNNISNNNNNSNMNNNNKNNRTATLYLKPNNFNIKHSKRNECIYECDKKCLISNAAKKIKKRINDLTYEYKQQIQLNGSGRYKSLIPQGKNVNKNNKNNNMRNYTTIRLNSDLNRDTVSKQCTNRKDNDNKKQYDKYLKTVSMYSNYKPKRRYYVSALNDIKGSFFESPTKKKEHYIKTESMFDAIK